MRVSQMNGNWHIVERQLSKVLGRTVKFLHKESVSGGCINQAWKISDDKGVYWFIKTNSSKSLDMFNAEADGLAEIKGSACIRSPKVKAVGVTEEFSYLVLEFITLHSQINQKVMGRQLAKMHQYYSINKLFGWKRDNTIGLTTQVNSLNKDWVPFWKEQRLLFQLEIAKSNGYSSKAYDAGLMLADNFPVFFSNYQPKPSLLHGDLWSGNCGRDTESNPVVFDPAVYYGDRETDIAMTELFGGFNADFYDAYNEVYPLDSAYKIRKILYNLYHILNHFNLFGGGYALQAENMTKQLLAEVN